jgi:hypothetical protein
MGLTGSDQDLARMRSRLAGDWTLERLLELTDGGMEIAITLYAPGMIFAGVMVPAEQWAARPDRQIDSALRERVAAVEGDGPHAGALEATRAALGSHTFAALVAERRQADDELNRRIEQIGPPVALDDLAEDDARHMIMRTSMFPAVALRDVVVDYPGTPRTDKLPFARILVSQVTAWHLGTEER